MVHYGGPVEPDIAVGLGRAPTARETIGPGLGTVDLTSEPDADGSAIKVYSGYAGWGVAQLEEEMAEGAWYVVDAQADDPFADPNTLWQRVLQRQGGSLALYSTFPEDPTSN